MHWFVLSLVMVYQVPNAQTANYNRKILEPDYLYCSPEKKFNPGVCDCRDRECFIKLTVTKNKFDTGAIDEAKLFSVNGGRIGPTIIVNHNALMVVDVYNEINDTENPENANVSIHWHGIHQWNTAWMDGVGMITQWPTAPGTVFRHIFRAHPPGTHWYHSHMFYQRDEGVLGAFIVRDEETYNRKKLLKDVVDEPAKKMFAIRDHIEVENNAGTAGTAGTSQVQYRYFEPDGSIFPLEPLFGFNVRLELFRLNGVLLEDELPPPRRRPPELEPIFYVERGKDYRFRIIGIMSSEDIRFSIDKHKLKVISSDGYLTEKFDTDILIIHIAERYDFILETDDTYSYGTVFPIRIETVAVQEDGITPAKVGYAYLQYVKHERFPESPMLIDHYEGHRRCDVEECKALNCPFEYYSPDTNIACHNVAELCLLDPTPRDQLPKDYVMERFFNFGFAMSDEGNVPSVNGQVNALPTNVPFVNVNEEKVDNECRYLNTKCEEGCAHSVYIPQLKKAGNWPPTVRFVFSSLSTRLATHPIHLHGHSFFVAKIAYPEYDDNGGIEMVNPDLTLPDPECGPPRWTSGTPEDIEVNDRTIRKDTIIVPAGGYVVVEFLADNPGWWFLHCHIDAHSNTGMAIAVNELPRCQVAPTYYSAEDSYRHSRWQFLHHERYGDKCGLMPERGDWETVQAREINEKSSEAKSGYEFPYNK